MVPGQRAIEQVEARLPASHFLRIHRSHIVNLEFITVIGPYDAGRVEVGLKSGIRIVASRTGSKRLATSRSDDVFPARRTAIPFGFRIFASTLACSSSYGSRFTQ